MTTQCTDHQFVVKEFKHETKDMTWYQYVCKNCGVISEKTVSAMECIDYVPPVELPKS